MLAYALWYVGALAGDSVYVPDFAGLSNVKSIYQTHPDPAVH